MNDRGEEAVVEQTADGVISRWDPAAEVMFGWTQVEALGMRCDWCPYAIAGGTRPR